MIEPERLLAVADWLARHGDRADLEQALRAAFPGLHFTFCSDDDVMMDEPAGETAGYRLYLVDGSEHCLTLTREAERATGLVVARIEEE